MTERFSSVGVLFNADAYTYSLEVAPRDEWVVLSKDMILWTGQEIAEATTQQSDLFKRRLGVILGAIAQRYTDMVGDDVDNIIEFGPIIREQTGITSCSPLEYALAILTDSYLGECIVDQYRRRAGEHNDLTCQRLLNHLLTTHVNSYQ
jgi:hypothetical protein